MIKQFLFTVILLASISTSAQIHEVGIQVGGSNYIGDIGPTNYIRPNDLALGILYKYNLNPRIALRGNFTYFGISSNDADSNHPGRADRGLSFNNSLYEFGAGVEFSFFEYNLDTQDKTHTPYILAEIAAVNYKHTNLRTGPDTYEYSSITTVAIPFGFGYKFKLAGPLAMAVEVGARYTIKDNIDYNNPYIPELTFGNPNNNDWYMFTGINLVYTFGRPPCYAE
ncbi:hypothetical protein KH5_11700 [Urechidicola sp. KH5]